MFNKLDISSHKGVYSVEFIESPFQSIKKFNKTNTILVIDRNILRLYTKEFEEIIHEYNILEIEATEENKNFTKIGLYIDKMLKFGIRRDHQLIAIGGGITQDITCFIATTLFRGVSWSFFPTTLLAQADSCIGSKSSINYKSVKNLLGTFTPPSKIFLSLSFQQTLGVDEIKSGIGEMIKVHLIDDLSTYRSLIKDYDFFDKNEIMLRHLTKSLEIKKQIIERDEFDKNERNVMNYGHSFGHAIESATNFKVPHGIAVTIGMDLANFISFKKNYISQDLYMEIKLGLKKNYSKFISFPIPFEKFLQALGRDKKNNSNQYALILFVETNQIRKRFFNKDTDHIEAICKSFFTEEFGEKE